MTHRPEDVWESEGTAQFAAKAIAFLLRAGLRPPTESTYRTMAVGLLLAGEGKDKAMEYDPHRRQAAFNMVKGWFLCEAAAYKNVLSVVHDLPQKPQLIQRSLSEKLYGERATPGKNLLAHVEFQTLLFNTRCRKSRTPYLGNAQPAVTWQGIEALHSQMMSGQQTMAPHPTLLWLQMKPQAVANVPASPVVPWSQHMFTPQ